MRKWRVAWEGNATGFSEHGGYIYETHDDAQQVADESNKHWPNFRHWVEQEPEPQPEELNG